MTRRPCSWTTTRTRGITRWRRRTRCAACRRHRVDADHLGGDRHRRAGRLHDGDGPGEVRRARRPARGDRSSGLPDRRVARVGSAGRARWNRRRCPTRRVTSSQRAEGRGAARRRWRVGDGHAPGTGVQSVPAAGTVRPPLGSQRDDAEASVTSCASSPLRPGRIANSTVGADRHRCSGWQARMVDEQVDARAAVDESVAAAAVEELDDTAGSSR